MTGFYGIFYNQPTHFCRGLVVAVVMPQYSAAAQLQRAFCSHAPSQEHRVTSLARGGKGAPAGLFCSQLVLLSFLFSSSFFQFPLLFIVPSSSSIFFFLFQSICPGDLHLRLIEKKSSKQKRGEWVLLVIQVWCVWYFIEVFSDCPAVAMDVALGRERRCIRGITRHLAQHSCVIVTLLLGRQRGSQQGVSLKSNINFRVRINRL